MGLTLGAVALEAGMWACAATSQAAPGSIDAIISVSCLTGESFQGGVSTKCSRFLYCPWPSDCDLLAVPVELASWKIIAECFCSASRQPGLCATSHWNGGGALLDIVSKFNKRFRRQMRFPSVVGFPKERDKQRPMN